MVVFAPLQVGGEIVKKESLEMTSLLHILAVHNAASSIWVVWNQYDLLFWL